MTKGDDTMPKPMVEHAEFVSQLVKNNTWMITGRGCTAYLCVGDNFGVMIDTGEYYEDIHEYVSTLTDKPVEIVLNTHGHFDHTGGNGFFKTALMGRLAAEIAKVPNGKFGEVHFSQFKTDYAIVVVDDGYKIDLGNRVIEAFKIDGHSPDSIAWLDHGERIVFGGDAVSDVVPSMYKCQAPQPSTILYVQSLGKLLAHREEFDYVLTGHGEKLFDASVVDYCMINALRALNGETDERPQRKAPVRIGPDGKPEKGPMDDIPEELKGFVTYNGVNYMFHRGYVKDTTRYDIVQGT